MAGSCGGALLFELLPAAVVFAHAPRFGLEFEDARHPFEKSAVVRDDGETASMSVQEALEQLERREIEVVRGLVQQEDVRLRREDRLELSPCGLAAGEARSLALLREIGDAELGGLSADDT